jgi:hypothetical protein
MPNLTTLADELESEEFVHFDPTDIEPWDAVGAHFTERLSSRPRRPAANPMRSMAL